MIYGLITGSKWDLKMTQSEKLLLKQTHVRREMLKTGALREEARSFAVDPLISGYFENLKLSGKIGEEIVICVDTAWADHLKN